MNYLGEKLNEVTYFKKFNEWPKDMPEAISDKKKIVYNFKDAKADEFAKLLLSRWGKKFRDEIDLILSKIEKNLITAEFPVPESEDELKKFVGIEEFSAEERRVLRQKLRNIAKEDSELYL